MVKCIFACTQDGVIGLNGRIPWDIKDDLKFFREQTEGKTVIMGRKTYESIGHPLPNRKNIVVTSKEIDNVLTTKNLQKALEIANSDNDVFVIGGAKLLNDAIPFADEIIVSFVDSDVNYTDKDDVTVVNLSFMEFFSLKSITPSNGFSIFRFVNTI